MDDAPQIVPPFAPEERYVYSSATPPIPALQRSAMWYCRTRSVGVGFPNPSGEETSPLQWMPRRKLSRLSLQRSDMSIAARHSQSPRSRGAQCALCLNHGLHGLHGLHGGRNCLNQDTQDLRIYRIKGGKPRRHGTGKRGSSLAYYRIKQQLRKSYQLS